MAERWFTQNPPAAARDPTPGSLQNDNSPRKIVKDGPQGLWYTSHPELKVLFFFFVFFCWGRSVEKPKSLTVFTG